MKILIVCSGNVKDFNFEIHHAFIYEQIVEVKNKYNVQYDTFFVRGKGLYGYLKNIFALRKKIRNYAPDLVHAHFGLSGLLSVLQRKVPVVITFHGSDLNYLVTGFLSSLAAILSQHDIFVSEKLRKRILISKKYSIIPCGINLDQFYPIAMKDARQKLKIDLEKKIILFASGFDNPVKNAQLAFEAVSKLNRNCEMIEIKNKTREEVNLLINSCNIILLTSFSEGSPQVIKEAMACNCPIVATDVGDIKEVIGNSEGCYITSFDSDDVADKIKLALNFGKRTDGREKIKHFDNKIIAEKVYNVYKAEIGY